ncbi:zf-HC2 domain-containing protein [Paenibacillus sediminis]|uniref:Anti-sigma-W factor RsiW n=1 Tax=Paenibacillus sediminis TaxID=664909 RepID=A0ABS4H2F7_9BACL|nr:putative anti-sigma-YlaC factor YlaD [Paenibacillus sediminis]
MRCNDVQNQMSAYVTHELAPEAARLVQQHIHTCAKCHAWYEEVTEMLHIWNEAEHSSSSYDLVAEVMTKLAVAYPDAPSITETKKRRLVNSQLYHYGLVACLTIIMFQFGVFEKLGYEISSVNNHFASTLELLFQSTAK